MDGGDPRANGEWGRREESEEEERGKGIKDISSLFSLLES